ncbi:hypothetical protein [Kordia jejudonensis]|uniref:hypothetical protein n=1 Tax=Kordia jejudonensis TaxID=1348245 RepID=UPI0006299B50|nr:hypothetical protein [Kordia jejudonensis]
MKKRNVKTGLKLSKSVVSKLENQNIFGGAASADAANPFETRDFNCWFMTRVKNCQLTLGPSNCTQC